MTAPSGLEGQVADALLRSGLHHEAKKFEATKFVVGASGGPDSTALLRCLHRLREDFHFTLHVAHLNHDFRGAEADHDAAFVQHLADGLGLPCSIDKQDPVTYQRKRGISSFEQAAREMRYSFLAAVAISEDASAVALGHTADDQAETVLLHLLRGSGLHGLRGMSELVDWPWPEPNPGPLLFRPMLAAGKADTAAYCRDLGQTYRQDSGNYMWRFTRNKVRLDLLPKLSRDYNPRVREALARLSRAAVQDLDFIETELARHWHAVAEESAGAVSFDIAALIALHPALQRHALRRAFATVAGDSRRLSERHLEVMLSLLHGEPGVSSVHLPRGIRAQKQYGTLTVAPGSEHPTTPDLPCEHVLSLPRAPGEILDAEIGSWRLTARLVQPGPANPPPTGPSGRFTALLDPETLGDAATLRTRRPGDRFQPSGMTGTRKLQDYFTDAKIPRDQRDAIPLLVSNRGIAWIVGHRVANWALPVDGEPDLSISLVPVDSETDC